MGPLSELSDGYEPHDHFMLRRQYDSGTGDGCSGGGVYPGWGIAGGCWEGYTGYPPSTIPGTHIQYIWA